VPVLDFNARELPAAKAARSSPTRASRPAKAPVWVSTTGDRTTRDRSQARACAVMARGRHRSPLSPERACGRRGARGKDVESFARQAQPLPSCSGPSAARSISRVSSTRHVVPRSPRSARHCWSRGL